MELSRYAVTIANNAALSNLLDLRDKRIVAIQMPASWTAADLTFQGSCDKPSEPGPGGTGFPTALADVYDDNAGEVTVKAGAAKFIVLRGDMNNELNGLGFAKIRSGTTGTPVNQGAARTIVILTEPYSR